MNIGLVPGRRLVRLRTRARRRRARRGDGDARRADPGGAGAAPGGWSTSWRPTSTSRGEVDALEERLATGPTRSYAASKVAAQRARVRQLGRAARARGLAAGGDGRLGGLRGGRRGLPREAHAPVRRGVSNPPRPVNTLRSPMDRRRPMRVILSALAPALAALLLTAVPACAGLILPEAGPSSNAQDTRTLYAIILVIAVIVFLGVEGVLIYCLVQVPRQARAGRGADPRQHAARDRLDGRRRGDPRLPDRGDLRDAPRDQEPRRVEHRRERQPGRLQRRLRVDRPGGAAQGRRR